MNDLYQIECGCSDGSKAILCRTGRKNDITFSRSCAYRYAKEYRDKTGRKAKVIKYLEEDHHE